MDSRFSTFRPRLPWVGPDLQTLRNVLRPALRPPPGVREARLKLPLRDGSGDALSVVLESPAEGSAGRPLVVLIHGLSGSEESAYMRTSAAWWLRRGHAVLRMNLRGAGPSRPLCRWQYHAGRTADLRDALLALGAEHASRGLLLVGYSLGGNMLLKFLAEHASEFPVRAAASVSAPIDLAASSRRFLDPRNRLYHRQLLGSMRREALTGASLLTVVEEEAIRTVGSIWEFDERFVAPRNGYRDAEHYYAENAALGFLREIRVPTLLVHALDDPWIPGEIYTGFPWSETPDLVPLLPEGGGHVGFHARGDRVPWHDRCIARFFDEVTPPADTATPDS